MEWLFPVRTLSKTERFPDRIVFSIVRKRRPSDIILLRIFGVLTLVVFAAGIFVEHALLIIAVLFALLTGCAWWDLYSEKPQILVADQEGLHTRWRNYPWRKIRDLRHGYGSKGAHGLEMDRGFWFTSILVLWISPEDCLQITKAIHVLFNGRPYGKDHPRIH